MKKKIKLSKFEWVKKNIVIVPVVAAILAGTFTSVRYVLSLTDTIEANKQTIVNLQNCLKGKRYAMKDKSSKDRVVYKCIKSKANIEIYMGEKKITSLILD